MLTALWLLKDSTRELVFGPIIATGPTKNCHRFISHKALIVVGVKITEWRYRLTSYDLV